MPANSDQQGGKSGKIHFIESTLFILALMAGFAPKMFSFRTLRESLGTPAPPGRSIGGALKGLTCSPVVGSEPVGSGLLAPGQACMLVSGHTLAQAPPSRLGSAPHWVGRLSLSQPGFHICPACSVLHLLQQALDCGPQGRHPAALGQGPVSLGSCH